jgi:hypothetical protein
MLCLFYTGVGSLNYSYHILFYCLKHSTKLNLLHSSLYIPITHNIMQNTLNYSELCNIN